MTILDAQTAENLILHTVEFLVENAAYLSKQRGQSVTLVENYLGSKESVYRAHASDVFPRMYNFHVDYELVSKVCTEFNEGSGQIEFNTHNLWFTLYL